jgi:hypothetical protein
VKEAIEKPGRISSWVSCLLTFPLGEPMTTASLARLSHAALVESIASRIAPVEGGVAERATPRRATTEGVG